MCAPSPEQVPTTRRWHKSEALQARPRRGAHTPRRPRTPAMLIARPRKRSNTVRARGIAIAVAPLPFGWIVLAIAIILVAPASASAEVEQLRISRGFGVHYLPLYVMEEKALLQK